MNVSHGMRVDEIEALGQKLQNQHAVRVRELVKQLDLAVNNTQRSWLGVDADRFRSWWPAKRASLLAIADDLHGFGQSARNNVTEQRKASEDRFSAGGAGSGAAIAGGAAATGAAGAASAAGGKDPRSLPAAHGAGAIPSWFKNKPEYDDWQCTEWAVARREQLGMPVGRTADGRTGHGGQMASISGGSTSTPPSFGAIASWQDGSYGHVMIVEEVLDGGNRIRVSEMNYGIKGGAYPEEYRADSYLVKKGGSWVYEANGHNVGAITFAT